MILPVIVACTVFLAVVVGVVAGYALVTQAPLREQSRVIGYRLESFLRAHEGLTAARSLDLFKRDRSAPPPWVQRLTARLHVVHAVQQALAQAEWRISVSSFLLRSLLLGAGVFALAALLWKSTWLALMLALLAGCVPYLYLMRRRGKRFDKFLEQLPEAVNLMGRALRAGHAVTTAFEMVADEMDEPIASEFRRIHDEQKFGLPLAQALAQLQTRVPLIDVRMLVTAVILQREVGGNLAEVLDNIAATIRDRFKLRRQVMVFTAQGRLTGYILVALPIFMGLTLSLINPGYMNTMLEYDEGMLMVAAAVLLQIIGFFWIRKIIQIKI